MIETCVAKVSTVKHGSECEHEYTSVPTRVRRHESFSVKILLLAARWGWRCVDIKSGRNEAEEAGI